MRAVAFFFPVSIYGQIWRWEKLKRMLSGMCVGTIAFYWMFKSSDLDCVALPGLDLLTCPPGEIEMALDAVAECWNRCKRWTPEWRPTSVLAKHCLSFNTNRKSFHQSSGVALVTSAETCPRNNKWLILKYCTHSFTVFLCTSSLLRSAFT